MKPHPRIRKTIKWGGAAVTVLLVVVWVGSGWWIAMLDFKQGLSVALWGGQIRATYERFVGEQFAIPDLDTGPYPTPFAWSFEWWTTGPVSRYDCPMWFPAGASFLITAAAWRLDALARRRARVGFCPKCNYDRTGLAAGAVCPECGRLPA